MSKAPEFLSSYGKITDFGQLCRLLTSGLPLGTMKIVQPEQSHGQALHNAVSL